MQPNNSEKHAALQGTLCMLPGRRAVTSDRKVCLRLTGRIYWIVRSLFDCTCKRANFSPSALQREAEESYNLALQPTLEAQASPHLRLR